jgi:hypothetical protein
VPGVTAPADEAGLAGAVVAPVGEEPGEVAAEPDAAEVEPAEPDAAEPDAAEPGAAKPDLAEVPGGAPATAPSPGPDGA